MTPAERKKLEARYWELEQTIVDIHGGKVVDGDSAELEGSCLEEQEIEHAFGVDYFERREP